MLIFVMLLLSSALMYYYFQRTRALEQEITSLRNGETPEDGLTSWIPWSTNQTKPEAKPAAAPVEATPLAPTVTSAEFPSLSSTGESTIDPADSHATLPPITANVDLESTAVLDMKEPAMASETQDSPTTDDEPEPPVEEQPETPQRIDSVYDAPELPPLKVRSPRRE